VYVPSGRGSDGLMGCWPGTHRYTPPAPAPPPPPPFLPFWSCDLDIVVVVLAAAQLAAISPLLELAHPSLPGESLAPLRA